MKTDLIDTVDHGVYGVDPGEIPCCPVCDQPMIEGEKLTLQTCDADGFGADLVRLIHSTCSQWYEDE